MPKFDDLIDQFEYLKIKDDRTYDKPLFSLVIYYTDEIFKFYETPSKSPILKFS